jgi:LPS-assembly lipoprotein
MTMRRRAVVSAALLATLLGGCGFKLRVAPTFAFQTLAVTPEKNGLLAADLIRYFGKAVVPLAPTPGVAPPQVIVDILQESREKKRGRRQRIRPGARVSAQDAHPVPHAHARRVVT